MSLAFDHDAVVLCDHDREGRVVLQSALADVYAHVKTLRAEQQPHMHALFVAGALGMHVDTDRDHAIAWQSI